MENAIIELLSNKKNNNLKVKEIAKILKISEEDVLSTLEVLTKEGIVYKNNDRYMLVINTSLKKGTIKITSKRGIIVILDNNEELAGKYSFNADTGLIEFEDGALEAAQDAAYKKEKSIQAQKMMADNAVGSSEIAVSNNRAVEENNAMNGWIAAGLTAVSTLFLPGIGMALGPILSGVLAASQESDDNKQTKALEALQEAYYQTGGNIAEAWLQLQPETKRLVESLGLTDA